jgi:hypothetical protein
MDYQSNSHKNKDKVVPPEKQEPKNLDKIVEGTVVRRKKPLGRRIKDTFIDGDAKNVKAYVIADVMVPAAKDMIWDVISSATERMLFGEVRGGRRNQATHVVNMGRVAYNKMSSNYQSQNSRYQKDEGAPLSRRARANHDFKDIILSSRAEGEEVLERLFSLVSQYEFASVADLYSILGITPEFTDDTWGWSDIRGAGISRVKGGYLLDLPVPEPLNKN